MLIFTSFSVLFHLLLSGQERSAAFLDDHHLRRTLFIGTLRLIIRAFVQFKLFLLHLDLLSIVPDRVLEVLLFYILKILVQAATVDIFQDMSQFFLDFDGEFVSLSPVFGPGWVASCLCAVLADGDFLFCSGEGGDLFPVFYSTASIRSGMLNFRQFEGRYICVCSYFLVIALRNHFSF